MKILISTGIYPPEIGGPAEYARNLQDALTGRGHTVSVKVFSKFNFFPLGIRHVLYFLSILPKVSHSDYVVVLDTFSCALPAVLACKLFRKKIVVRTGGDFLWEAYVERTKEPVLLKDFYNTSLGTLSLKERIIFRLMRWTLQNLSGIVWSTEWQKDIFMKPYGLSKQRHFIVENFYAPVIIKDTTQVSEKKVFLSPSRDIFLKNKKILKEVFAKCALRHPDIALDTNTFSQALLKEKFSQAYAVVLPSLSDISPNLVLDALRYCVPIIVTQETGITDRLEDLVVFIDPLSKESIQEGIEKLLNFGIYDAYKRKLTQRMFTHSWEQIAHEFLDIYKQLCNR